MMRALDFYQWLLAVGAGILIYSFLLSIQVLPNSPLTPSHLKSVDSQSSEKAGTALPATNSSAQLQGQTSGDCSRGGTGCPSPRTGQDADRHSKVASSPSPDSWGNLLMGKLLEENQEERLSTLTTECKQLRERGVLPQSPSPRVQEWLASRIYVADRYAFMYCEVPKTGCTNWKRTFLALMGNIKSSKVMTQNQVHSFNYTKLSSFDTSGQRSRLDNYTMVMFVREPMERLVSAYRDKFLHSKHYKEEPQSHVPDRRPRRNFPRDGALHPRPRAPSGAGRALATSSPPVPALSAALRLPRQSGDFGARRGRIAGAREGTGIGVLLEPKRQTLFCVTHRMLPGTAELESETAALHILLWRLQALRISTAI
ncbi:uncharacterized protein LOC144735994 isoform X2 [Lampetra planeri]